MEIERKYLVAALPEDLESYPHIEIEQGYLCKSPTLRIRRMGDFFVLTVKEKLHKETSAIVNREEEFSLPEADYYRLREARISNLVCKTRYRVDLRRSEADGLYEGLVAEVDIFHGQLEGLQLVEVEFPNVQTAEGFVMPKWFGPEVSGDSRYSNSYLSSVENAPEAK